MSVRIVTDTSCDLPPELERESKELGVKVVPFLFHFGLEAHEDKSMSIKEFLARAAMTWPTTAAPSVGAFAQAFRECIEAGDQVVCMTITSKHSATYSSAVLASQQFPAGQVTVVDSRSLSLGQGLLVLAAARAGKEGKSPAQVVEVVRALQQRLHFFIGLDTVEYLVKGGRASRLTGALASVFRIRPILGLMDGELTLVEKPRGKVAAQQKLLQLVVRCFPAEVVGVIHIEAETLAQELAAAIASQTGYPLEKILIVETGLALATHGGPGAVGVVVVSSVGPSDKSWL